MFPVLTAARQDSGQRMDVRWSAVEQWMTTTMSPVNVAIWPALVSWWIGQTLRYLLITTLLLRQSMDICFLAQILTLVVQSHWTDKWSNYTSAVILVFCSRVCHVRVAAPLKFFTMNPGKMSHRLATSSTSRFVLCEFQQSDWSNNYMAMLLASDYCAWNFDSLRMSMLLFTSVILTWL